MEFPDNKILIIDDENYYRKAISRIILKNLKAQVIEARNFMEGFDYIKKYPVDLVLLDMQMPSVDGPRGLKIIRSDPLTKDIPVIAFTAHSNEELVKGIIKLGISDYIIKSIDTDIMVKKISNVHTIS